MVKTKTILLIAIGATALGYILYNKNKVNSSYVLSKDSIYKKNDVIAFAKQEKIYTNNLDNALDAMGVTDLNYVYDYLVKLRNVIDQSFIPNSLVENYQRIKKQYNILK